VLLVQRPGEVQPTPIVLEHVTVYYGMACTIRHPTGAQEQGTFTIVSCAPTDPSLFPHFLTILAPLVAALGPAPSAAGVRGMISALVELFRALSTPARKTVQGVWAEMFVIVNATDLRAVAAAWHRMPVERFDFGDGSQRVEVKSSSSRRREHHFALGQLAPAAGVRVAIASLFVERSGGGLSVARLSSDIRAALTDPEATAHFDAALYGTLGSGWPTAMDEAFDAELARDSLQFYWAENVPQVSSPPPPSVTDVRFCSDLSGAEVLSDAAMVTAGGLFAAVRPRQPAQLSRHAT
jgi:hypothetical protein